MMDLEGSWRVVGWRLDSVMRLGSWLLLLVMLVGGRRGVGQLFLSISQISSISLRATGGNEEKRKANKEGKIAQYASPAQS
jgi:hypothetical protein